MVEDAFASLLPGLDLIPALTHASRRPRLGVAEHVWMTPDELCVYVPRDRSEVRRAALLEEQREEVHLEEEIAELVRESRVVARDRGVRDLVSLFDRVRDDRARGLLAVPRAFAAEPRRQFLEILERAPEVAHVVVVELVSERQGSGVGS